MLVKEKTLAEYAVHLHEAVWPYLGWSIFSELVHVLFVQKAKFNVVRAMAPLVDDVIEGVAGMAAI